MGEGVAKNTEQEDLELTPSIGTPKLQPLTEQLLMRNT